MIVSALFLAISLVFRYYSAELPLFGANGMRVGIHGVFAIMPAILFGPWYGAVVSGLGDVLGHLLRPLESYLPVMTVVMVVGGFLRGSTWRLLRNRNAAAIRVAVLSITILFLLFGGYGIVRLRIDGVNQAFFEQGTYTTTDTASMGFISRLLIERSVDSTTLPPSVMFARRRVESTYAPIVAGVFGLMLLGVDIFVSKRVEKEKTEGQSVAYWNGSIMPLALTIILVSLLINFANTIVLRELLFDAWKLLPFTVVWLPRALSSFMVSIVNVYIAAVLLGICNKQPHIRKLCT